MVQEAILDDSAQMNEEMGNLVETLFGARIRQLLHEGAEEQSMKQTFKQCQDMLAKMVGPQNAQKQLEAIKQKYLSKNGKK